MAKLLLVGDPQNRSFDINKNEVVIGRRPENDIQLESGTVSGRHAKISQSGNGYVLEDLGSTNGTLLNGNPVKEKVPLRNDDVLQFGQQLAKFQAPETASAGLSSNPLLSKGSLFQAIKNPDQRATVEDTPSSITGTLVSEGRFGGFDVNPAAKLKAVLEISTSLAGNHNLNEILPKILEILFGIFRGADRGCIMTRSIETGELVPAATRHRNPNEDASIRLSRTIVNHVLEKKSGVLSADASSDAAFNGSQSIADLKIRSMMCVPLLGLDGEPIGLISIDSSNPLAQFTQNDLEILMTVAGQAALSYEGARLLTSYMEKQKQDSEMKIAEGVQQALLPKSLPEIPGYEFYASYDAAQAVGGDYYDCIRLPDGKIAFSFGDVAGKGVPGALIMSRIHSCVQSTLKHVHEVVPAILSINEHMCESPIEGRFVTYVLLVLDPKTGQFTFSNAGHNSPIIRRLSGEIQLNNEDLVGPPIAVVKDYPYEAETHRLEPGDMIVLVTDGVTEAMSPQGTFYEEENTIDFIRKQTYSPSEMGKQLLLDVRKHANGRAQNDDITIMVIGRTK